MQGVEIWNQINESAQIVVWPVVVVLGLVLFRTKLGEVVQRLREADTPVGTMKFDPSDQLAANRDIAETAGILVETLRGEFGSAALSPSGSGTPEGGLQPPGLQGIESDVEAVIRASFAAGFELSRLFEVNDIQIDEGRSPAPVIDWEAGKPLVVGYELYVPDYTSLRTSFDIAGERLARLDEIVSKLDGAITALEEEAEKAGRAEDREAEASIKQAVDEGRKLLDSISSGLVEVKKSQEKMAKARVFVPVRRWLENRGSSRNVHWRADR